MSYSSVLNWLYWSTYQYHLLLKPHHALRDGVEQPDPIIWEGNYPGIQSNGSLLLTSKV